MELYLLTAVPFLLALLTLVLPIAISRVVLVGSVVLVMLASLALFASYQEPSFYTLSSATSWLFVAIDFVVILTFLTVGVRYKHKLAMIFAAIQLLLFAYVVFGFDHTSSDQIMVDSLATLFILLVSIVGGVITIYSISYMRYEHSNDMNKKAFSAILLAFLGVMNLLAVSNDIELFFLAFELTTLASFVLIGWRKDDIAKANAVLALWMNQIGGVALLLGMILLLSSGNSLIFSELISSESMPSGVMLVFALFSVAALIKGAQMPFDKWLLGAMVAPTPVSAILHSSTMVKIAPFMMIKFSPLIASTALGTTITIFGGVVFVVAAFLALSKLVFKEILAYSTISLLGLMIMLAAIGTPLAITASITLIFFHGIAKALLFMEAGLFEKVFKLKSVDEMGGILSRAPISSFLVLLGFVSVTLPPFGALVGKWVALEASLAASFVFIFIALGSVLLTLLYFKVAGFMLSKDGKILGLQAEVLPFGLKYTTLFLGVLLISSALFISPILVYLFSPAVFELLGVSNELATSLLGLSMPAGSLPFWQILTALLLLLFVPIAGFLSFKSVDRAREYSGGERLDMKPLSFYFDASARTKTLISLAGVLFFVAMIGVSI